MLACRYSDDHRANEDNDMTNTRKVLVALGVMIGAVGIGAAASAAVDHSADDDTVTGSSSTTTTHAAPTTETAPDSSSTTTTQAAPTTEAPAATEGPLEGTDEQSAEGPPEAALFGQCTAFSGRSQPGNSQAYQRLEARAGGDIAGFCAEILGAPRGDESEPEAPELDAQEKRNGNGNGNGNGKGPGRN
jgi:hypothetical protein